MSKLVPVIVGIATLIALAFTVFFFLEARYAHVDKIPKIEEVGKFEALSRDSSRVVSKAFTPRL